MAYTHALHIYYIHALTHPDRDTHAMFTKHNIYLKSDMSLRVVADRAAQPKTNLSSEGDHNGITLYLFHDISHRCRHCSIATSHWGVCSTEKE